MCLGIPGQIVDLAGVEQHKAVVDIDGVRREVNIGLVAGDEGGVAVGDWVLVHVGFAMSKIDEQEAQETLRGLRDMEQIDDDHFEELPTASTDVGAE
ncbi:MAG: HypC/HybG/HupF family hydrogenase formation chaperone [Actinobacteria bacterium]|nr:HypC/HybG/HupF family hydrogenase formation chaperone [Actinomycetota bacterium]